ncbi:MAG: fibronectin type III domain-containing protein [Planctomycetota bacterium]
MNAGENFGSDRWSPSRLAVLVGAGLLTPHRNRPQVSGFWRGTKWEEETCGRTLTLIRSTGLDVRAASTAAVGPLAQAANLSVTLGDFDGELDLDWDNVRGARSYQIQRSPDPVSATSWTLIDTVTASRATVKNLTSGTKYWFRVAAIGAAGPGPWSNPVAKIAP